MKNVIQTFEPNVLGHDYVIGDLHGSLSCLENLLVNINFDPTKDRLFSVGDLVDRGPASLKCLELLNDVISGAVLSNHEHMMLDAFKGGWIGEYWIPNGGSWGASALRMKDARDYAEEHDKRLYEMLPIVEELPYLITIKMRDGKKFHLIHAEMPPGIDVDDEDLADPEKVLALAKKQSDSGDYFLWGRSLFLSFYGQNNHEKIKRIAQNKLAGQRQNPKLSHIISGHTILQHPLTLLGKTDIDTGAFKTYERSPAACYGLTCIDLNSWTFFKATSTNFEVIQPIVITEEDVNTSLSE